MLIFDLKLKAPVNEKMSGKRLPFGLNRRLGGVLFRQITVGQVATENTKTNSGNTKADLKTFIVSLFRKRHQQESFQFDQSYSRESKYENTNMRLSINSDKNQHFAIKGGFELMRINYESKSIFLEILRFFDLS